jgi:hypothetical protein
LKAVRLYCQPPGIRFLYCTSKEMGSSVLRHSQ